MIYNRDNKRSCTPLRADNDQEELYGPLSIQCDSHLTESKQFSKAYKDLDKDIIIMDKVEEEIISNGVKTLLPMVNHPLPLRLVSNLDF